MKTFFGDKKYAYSYIRLNIIKKRLTILCLSGFELYSRWVTLELEIWIASGLTTWNFIYHSTE